MTDGVLDVCESFFHTQSDCLNATCAWCFSSSECLEFDGCHGATFKPCANFVAKPVDPDYNYNYCPMGINIFGVIAGILLCLLFLGWIYKWKPDRSILYLHLSAIVMLMLNWFVVLMAMKHSGISFVSWVLLGFNPGLCIGLIVMGIVYSQLRFRRLQFVTSTGEKQRYRVHALGLGFCFAGLILTIVALFAYQDLHHGGLLLCLQVLFGVWVKLGIVVDSISSPTQEEEAQPHIVPRNFTIITLFVCFLQALLILVREYRGAVSCLAMLPLSLMIFMYEISTNPLKVSRNIVVSVALVALCLNFAIAFFLSFLGQVWMVVSQPLLITGIIMVVKLMLQRRQQAFMNDTSSSGSNDNVSDSTAFTSGFIELAETSKPIVVVNEASTSYQQQEEDS